jgi:hypothetical protein
MGQLLALNVSDVERRSRRCRLSSATYDRNFHTRLVVVRPEHPVAVVRHGLMPGSWLPVHV